MENLTYEQTVELEKNIQIKNEANELYKDFIDYYKLNIRSFKNGQFEDWNDSNNRCYVTLDRNTFTYHCRFLHESYDIVVTPEFLFGYIKNKYRGYDHFKSAVNSHKTGRRQR